jgi:hypothetical protein
VNWGAFFATVLLITGCGDDGTGPDPAVAPLVGDWSAIELVMTSVANPDIAPELIGLGAAFKLNVQPSGQYTAVLLYAMQSATEIGWVTLSGNTLTLNRDFPTRSVSTSIYSLSGDTLTLDGDSRFDFNLDGTLEDALAHFVLVRN